MAYQRTEYADKTMFMNSMADRRLKIQLDSINFHRDSIGKEIDREKKKIKKELAEVENNVRSRLSAPDSLGEGVKRLSPRLPRRYSTPQVLLSTSTSSRNLSDTDKRSPAAIRRRISSEGNTDVGLLRERALLSPTRPLSPASQFLPLPPLSQPRRQSLPPIGAGGSLVAADLTRESSSPRRGSCNGSKSPRGCLTPNSSSPLASPRRGSAAMNEGELEEVACKVERFLQKMDLGKQDEMSSIDVKVEDDGDFVIEEENDFIHPLTDRTVKRATTFQPSNFE